ncbi:MAG TPA: hypothetical protein VK789_26740 [Bryobacteraceae bacterium]|nr:hypothetical protein [Bryobacteraceae bacterium]
MTAPDPTAPDPKDIATIAGLIIAAISLLYTALNSRASLRTNRARFWLDLRQRFAEQDAVHRRLRPGGAWANPSGPASPEEWADLEAYMGLFEHCEVMIDQGLIDSKTFMRFMPIASETSSRTT